MEQTENLSARDWWERRRISYNVFLLAALFFGFIATLVAFDYGPRSDVTTQSTFSLESGVTPAQDNDIGGAALILPCCTSLTYLLLGNIVYSMAAGTERFFGIDRVDLYRKRMWIAGALFSCALPFSITVIHLFRPSH